MIIILFYFQFGFEISFNNPEYNSSKEVCRFATVVPYGTSASIGTGQLLLFE
jgi:hypothetical protein